MPTSNNDTKAIAEFANFIAESVAAIGGIGAVVALMTKFAAPRIMRYYKMIKQFRTIIENLPAFMATSQTVASELNTNGGSSMKDAILRIENIVSQNAAKHHSIWKNAPVPMFYANGNGDLTEVNSRMISLLQRDDSQLIGMNWLNSVSQLERSRVSEEWSHAFAQRRNVEIECIVTLAGRPHNALITAEPIMVNGNLLSYTGSIIIKDDQNAQHIH